jgi:hypothetical protein
MIIIMIQNIQKTISCQMLLITLDVCFVDRCLSFCTFLSAIVLSVLIRYTDSDYLPLVSSGFWLPLWYLRYTDSDYPFGIFKLFLNITSGSIIYKYISNKGENPANNHKYVHYFSVCIHSMLLYKANFVRFISNLHGRFLILWCQQLQK